MLCGSMPEKSGCLNSPKSPASTAGNSNCESEESFNLSLSLGRGDLRDEVLVLDKVSWNEQLATPEDVARLSRSILAVNELFLSPAAALAAKIVWRMFQAADKGYNGYITASGLNRVLLTVLPRISHMKGPFVDLSDGGTRTMLYWDVLSWWRELDLSDTERQIVHHNVIKRMVVPSDGLWAGVGLGATVRVWGIICRSCGFLYRFHAENYILMAFRQIQSQGLTKEEMMFAQLEVALILIRDSLFRIGDRKAFKVWRSFLQLDLNDDCSINYQSLCETLTKEKLAIPPEWSTAPMSRSSSSSVDDCISEPDDKSQFSLVQVLDSIVRRGCIQVGRHISVLPGQPIPSNFVSEVSSFFTKLVTAAPQSLPPLIRAKSNRDDSAVRKYVKQYLDVEQWRGQIAAELKANQKI
jgi:hypothetical protein